MFLYAGLPGERRWTAGVHASHQRRGHSEAPITHHWLDSTHITFGVVTAGLIIDKWKWKPRRSVAASPTSSAYDIETPNVDSFSARLSWNPLRETVDAGVVGAASFAEQLSPSVDEDRVTASAIYTRPFGKDNLWSTTAAWGRKILRPGQTLELYVESALVFNKT